MYLEFTKDKSFVQFSNLGFEIYQSHLNKGNKGKIHFVPVSQSFKHVGSLPYLYNIYVFMFLTIIS